ncbi:MAG: glycosyltransferase family 39 protein [Anaerolineae bacterium]|nr:glycosyltransferase family 39 protein [Anaerolineae bacterium]
MTRNQALRWLVVILLVACGLRLVNLGGRSLWYDEAFAVLFAETGLEQMIYGTLAPVEGGASDIHPLLYYTTLDGWVRLTGQSPEAVRLYSVLTGVLTVAVVFRLAAELFGRRVGVAAAAITALAAFHIQYSQEARMYALLTLFLLLATWCYLRAWRGGGRTYWIAFGVLAALAMYTQQLAAFYLVALGLTPFLARRRDRVWPTVGAAVLAFALYLPWAVNLPGQLSKLQAYYWVERPSFVRPLLTLRSFVSVALDVPQAWGVPLFVAGGVLIVFLALQAWLRRRRMRTSERRALAWVLWLAFGSLALMWLESQVFAPTYLDRALLAQGVVFYVALAWLFVRGGLPGPIRAVLVILAAGVSLLGYVALVTWRTFPNPPFEQAVTWLAETVAGGDAVIHSNKLTMLPMTYYARLDAPELAQVYLADRPNSPEDTLALPTQEVLGLFGEPCVAAAAGGADRVWFVIFAQEEPQILGLMDEHPHLGWLRAHYTAGEPVAFEDLLVIPFTDPDDVARSAPGCEEAAQ